MRKTLQPAVLEFGIEHLLDTRHHLQILVGDQCGSVARLFGATRAADALSS